MNIRIFFEKLEKEKESEKRRRLFYVPFYSWFFHWLKVVSDKEWNFSDQRIKCFWFNNCLFSNHYNFKTPWWIYITHYFSYKKLNQRITLCSMLRSKEYLLWKYHIKSESFCSHCVIQMHARNSFYEIIPFFRKHKIFL